MDKEYLEMPKPWDIDAIRRFMMIFGPVSSLFDFITFGVLLFFFKASEVAFHTGWFLESLCTQTLVIHVIRTSKMPLVKSRPSRFLALMSLFIISVGLAIPYSPIAGYLGFEPPSMAYLFALSGIVGLYLMMTQIVKMWYVKRYGQ